MARISPWHKGLPKDLRDKVRENALGHNLRITTRDSSGKIFAFCPYQADKPAYIILAGKPTEIKNKVKSIASQGIIPTYDQEVVILRT